MFVRDCMTPKLFTIPRETSVLEALEIMRRQRIKRLPVIEDDKVVGLVTERDLLRVSPSPVTTLSIFEVNYLISKMTVKEVMLKRPITVSPGATIEEAALLMRQHQIGDLLVLEDGKLAGIITQTDIFEALIELLGLRRPGCRLTLEVEDRVGILADVSRLVKDSGINIISVANRLLKTGKTELILRLETGDAQNLISILQKHGFKVLSLIPDRLPEGHRI